MFNLLTDNYLAEEHVQKLADRGYNVIAGAAESISIGEKFDCIFAGELIEHLSNPGRFLGNMKSHLIEGGCLILTTPNPFWPYYLIHVLLHGEVVINPEHTCWYCPQTLRSLLQREGFEDIEMHYTNRVRRLFKIGALPTLIRPWFCKHIVAVAKHFAK